MKHILFPLFAMLFFASCSDGFTTFPVSPDKQESLSEQVSVIRLDASNISNFASPMAQPQRTNLPYSSNWDYKVGTGDVLSIVVFDHPELTLPAGPQRSAEDSGFAVQADGTFFYPYVGQIRAKGRSVQDIRSELAEKLAEYIPSPQVEVRVAAFNSQSTVVAGEVKAPNRQALSTVPLTLLEAVNAAGGVTENADTSRISLQRGGRTYHVDLDGFLSKNIRANNPILRNGDIVNVPRRITSEAYILGEVIKPSPVDLSVEPITLTQALTRQGGLNQIRADARGVFVFRKASNVTTVYQLETSSPEGWLLGTRFALEPHDVVYVTRSPLQRWNDTISRLLPTVNAVSAVDDISN